MPPLTIAIENNGAEDGTPIALLYVRRLSCGPKWGRASDSHHCRSAPLGSCCERDRVPVIARPFGTLKTLKTGF
jgi:hypothetical protein